MRTIIVDPGHGGTIDIGGSSRNNVAGPRGTLEKDLTLEIGALAGSEMSTRGHVVYLTRLADVNLGLVERASMSRLHDADVFISIHFNGAMTSSRQGTEVYYHRNASDDSKLLSEAVLRRVVEERGERLSGVYIGDLELLNPTWHAPATAACLAEICYLTNPGEESLLMQAEYKARLARAVAKGVADYLDGREDFKSSQ